MGIVQAKNLVAKGIIEAIVDPVDRFLQELPGNRRCSGLNVLYLIYRVTDLAT